MVHGDSNGTVGVDSTDVTIRRLYVNVCRCRGVQVSLVFEYFIRVVGGGVGGLYP